MKVKELLSDKSKWTQKTLARNKEGIAVSYLSPTAFSFCLVGAVEKCYSLEDKQKAYKVLSRIVERTRFDPAYWNDSPGRTFEEVKALVEELDI